MTLRSRVSAFLTGGLLRASAMSLVMALASMVLFFGVAALLARFLGVSGYGDYAFLVSLIALLRLPSVAGLPMLLVREVGAARTTADWARFRGVVNWVLRVSMMSAVPITLGVVLLGIVAPQTLPAQLWGPLYCSLGLVILSPLAAISGGIMRGLKRVQLGQAPEQIIQPGVMLLILAVLFLIGRPVDSAEGAMVANVASTLVACAAGGLVLMFIWPRAAGGAKPAYHAREWRAALLPLGLSNAMYQLDGQVAILALGLVAGSHETGLFKAAVQFAGITALGYSVVNANISPRLIEAFARDDRPRLAAIATQGARLSTIYCMPAAVGLTLIGGWVLDTTMGRQFHGAWGPLAILCLGHLINAYFGSSTALLNMTRNERINTFAFGTALVLNVGLTVLLAHRFGMVGAAVAATASVTIRNVILWVGARRRLGVDSSIMGLAPRAMSKNA
jgi:O-antigen/teichoic acid export membrane protein